MVTNEQIQTFRNIAELFLRSASDDTKETRLFHAVDKLFKKLKKKHEHYNDKINSARRSFALFDPKTKKLLMNGDRYEYDKDGLDKLEVELRRLQYLKVDVRPEYIPEEQLPSLKFEFQGQMGQISAVSDYEVRSAFTGFVIEPDLELVEEEEEELEEAEA